MRILVCGGRDYHDWNTFRNVMEIIGEVRFPRHPEDDYGNYLYKCTVIAGGAQGADALAADWAMINWTGYEEYKADWDKHGKAAGPIRNRRMLVEGKPDLVIAFPGGKGTANMVKLATEANVEVIEVSEDGNIKHRSQRAGT